MFKYMEVNDRLIDWWLCDRQPGWFVLGLVFCDPACKMIQWHRTSSQINKVIMKFQKPGFP